MVKTELSKETIGQEIKDKLAEFFTAIEKDCGRVIAVITSKKELGFFRKYIPYFSIGNSMWDADFFSVPQLTPGVLYLVSHNRKVKRFSTLYMWRCAGLSVKNAVAIGNSPAKRPAFLNG